MPWIKVDDRHMWEPESDHSGMPFNPDGTEPTEWQRAQRWATEQASIRRALTLGAYRLVVAARQLHDRVRNFRDRLS
ncbi:hypothetical protein RDE2_07360 [Rhodococcus sp. RDE2]|nr:hypothetical protein RDE2_07360 [Rhodococcus sp. RDE2]